MSSVAAGLLAGLQATGSTAGVVRVPARNPPRPQTNPPTRISPTRWRIIAEGPTMGPEHGAGRDSGRASASGGHRQASASTAGNPARSRWGTIKIRDIRLGLLRTRGITVTRRPTGGAVYHDSWGDVSLFPSSSRPTRCPGPMMECYELLCNPFSRPSGGWVSTTRASPTRTPAVYEPAMLPSGVASGPRRRRTGRPEGLRQRRTASATPSSSTVRSRSRRTPSATAPVSQERPATLTSGRTVPNPRRTSTTASWDDGYADIDRTRSRRRLIPRR